MTPRFDNAESPTPWPPVKPDPKSKNPPPYDAREHLLRITGVELVAVTGRSGALTQTIMAEIGTAMRTFPTIKPCCSWRGLAPHHDRSGGRVLRSRTLQVVARAPPAFRQAAQSVARSGSAFGASCRTMRARLGPQQATGATAHKLARVVDHLLTHHDTFPSQSVAEYECTRRERERKHLRRRARQLGYTLIPVAAAHPAPAL